MRSRSRRAAISDCNSSTLVRCLSLSRCGAFGEYVGDIDVVFAIVVETFAETVTEDAREGSLVMDESLST